MVKYIFKGVPHRRRVENYKVMTAVRFCNGIKIWEPCKNGY